MTEQVRTNSIYVHNHMVAPRIASVIDWANDRNIINGSTVKDQTLKLVSEVGELADNVAKGRCPIDDIGDCMVVLSIIAEMSGLTMAQCLEHAYNDIKNRKGRMTNGVFVKEGDL